MTTEKLLFLDPQFRWGTQITVRNGRKWDNIISEFPTSVDIYKTGEEDKKLGVAKIIGKMVTRVPAIPYGILDLEHSPGCRWIAGLTRAMKNAYGEDWSPSENEVTVLFFEYNPNVDDSKLDS